MPRADSLVCGCLGFACDSACVRVCVCVLRGVLKTTSQLLVPVAASETTVPRMTADVLLLEEAFTTLVTAVYLLPPAQVDVDRLVQITFYQELARICLGAAAATAPAAASPVGAATAKDTASDKDAASAVSADAEREEAALGRLYAFVTRHAFGHAMAPPPGAPRHTLKMGPAAALNALALVPLTLLGECAREHTYARTHVGPALGGRGTRR